MTGGALQLSICSLLSAGFPLVPIAVILALCLALFRLHETAWVL